MLVTSHLSIEWIKYSVEKKYLPLFFICYSLCLDLCCYYVLLISIYLLLSSGCSLPINYFLNCLCMCGFLTRLLLIKGFQFRQYMFLDLGSHCSIAILEALIQWSGVCGHYISYCLLQHMASFYLNISLNGEKNCLVSIHTSILFFFFFLVKAERIVHFLFHHPAA